MGEEKVNQIKNSTLLQTEYLKLLKQIKNRNKETENKGHNIEELQKLTEVIARNKQKTPITRRKPNKTCQSMIVMDFNTTSVSNIKRRARAGSRLGQTCRKDKVKIRGSSTTGIKTERSVTKVERSNKPEFFLSSKEGHMKRNKSHAQTSDITSTQSESQKRSTQSLLRLTSRIFNQKHKDYAL
jgi:hypothetical protein